MEGKVIDYSKVEFKPLSEAGDPGSVPPEGGANSGVDGGAGAPGGVQKDTTPAGGSASAGEPNKGAEGNGAAQQPAITDDAVLKILKERGYQVEKLDDIKSAFEERTSLKTQVETLSKRELEFPNEKAKALYEFAKNFNGNEIAAAKALLNVADLDFQKADPKTVQFEAFCIQFPQLSRERASAIFNEQYAQDYGDGNFEGKEALKFKHEQATAAAQKAIESAVTAFKSAKETPVQDQSGASEKDIEVVQKGVEGVLKEFKGANIQLGEYKSKSGDVVPSGAMNVAMKPEEAAKFKGYLLDPESFVKDVISKYKDQNGFNWNGYVNDMFQFVNREEIHAKILAQGVEQGQLLMLNRLNNSAGGKKPEAENGGAATKKTIMEQYESSRQAV